MKVLNLKEYREKMKLSQRDIAGLLNVSQQCYCLWENGKTFPSGEKIIDMCNILMCTPNDLFGFHGVFSVTMTKLDE